MQQNRSINGGYQYMLRNWKSVEVLVDGQCNNESFCHSFLNVLNHLTPTLDTLKGSKPTKIIVLIVIDILQLHGLPVF